MKSSKNNLLLGTIFFLSIGCQSTKHFEMTPSSKPDLYVIKTDSNRVVHECYFMNAEKENNWRHLYTMNILGNNNDVIPIYYPVNQDADECKAHIKKVEKVLKKSNQVRLCARGKLDLITDGTKIETLDFGPLGKHDSHFHALTFDTICNDKECVSISDTWTYTCPELQK
jgi:hypothetical protein